MRSRAAAVVALLLVGTTLCVAPARDVGAISSTMNQSGASADPPVLAYYYIWFDPTSWQRAKTDYPELGRYSSDERRVMERHVADAKAAGIDGFIVSWKHTPKLDRRLATLADVARDADFELSVIYQGLDFERDPLPIARVRDDFTFFHQTFANDEAFIGSFGRPVLIWSGTWKFSVRDVKATVASQPDDVLVLATERNAADYRAVQDVFDGNAYYWASVNPATYPAHPQKLAALGEVVHEDGGLWIAPVAPGFDARLVGGTSLVPRRDGQTLRTEWNAATRSGPDAIGLISWNEFSENTHIEPSEQFGSRYLDIVASLTGASGPSGELDSSSPAGPGIGLSSAAAIGGIVVVAAASLFAVRRRDRRMARPATRIRNALG